jgi:hypothetical protein
MVKTRGAKKEDSQKEAEEKMRTEDPTDESTQEPSSDDEASLDGNDDGDKLKTDNNSDEQNSELAAAKEAHYSIFGLLFMLGFMIHCRKYPEDPYSSVTMGHIVAYISAPRAKTTFYQDVIFLSFCSFCLYTMLQDSPYNANHHNMYVYFSMCIPYVAVANSGSSLF